MTAATLPLGDKVQGGYRAVWPLKWTLGSATAAPS